MLFAGMWCWAGSLQWVHQSSKQLPAPAPSDANERGETELNSFENWKQRDKMFKISVELKGNSRVG